MRHDVIRVLMEKRRHQDGRWYSKYGARQARDSHPDMQHTRLTIAGIIY